MSTEAAPRSPLKGRLTLLFIVALFAVPLAIAWALVGQWHPTRTTNKGELLKPARPVEYLRARQADGQAVTETTLRGHWTLLYVGEGAACEQACRTGLYNIRQVRLALGKDMGRARTLFILPSTPEPSLLAWIGQEHPALTLGVADAPSLAFFNDAFGPPSAPGNWVYLIDPLGNLFMRYRIDSNPKGMLDDLKHLLRFSELG